MLKKILIGLIILVAVAVAIYFIWKAERDKADRLILNGMTRKEFLKSIRPQWESEFRSAMQAYISDPATDWNKAIINELQTTYAGIAANSNDYQNKREELIAHAVEFAWAENPNPMDIEWAREFWVSKVIDGMGLNVNDQLVQTLLYKI